ncbi:apolipoprotein N-acyltransferase [Alysiella crassa]|uniref:Apolipoprotein N-acyltransferase n=1 Tax=Alysiella crassa TaxID=153491 RepID=A0A376BV21_9NEIS|nr:apolipoprotein N-acyltransferase [Alysiella crassa]UOP06342.1 apolipoprotein N-acyltransferase [Alysiella crassa]SSY80852.1 Apolipoprotein N-acyltransferase [Alysiella crassa]
MALSLQHILRKPFRHFFVLTLLALATRYAFAPYYQFWLMPLIFAGLVTLTELRPHCRVLTAFWFGLVAYTTQFWWIHTALHDVSGLPNVYAIPLTFLLPIFLATFPAIAFWLDEKHHLPRPWAIGVMLPLLWTITEFARERVFTGFGWGALGYSQITNGYSPLSAFAPIGGIHLVTLATAAVGCWLVLILRNRSWWQRGIFATLMAILLFQAHDLSKLEYTYRQPKPISVALLQGNIPQNLKFDDAQLVPTYQTYFNQVAKTKAEIVVLPETAFPQFLQHIDKKLIERFAEQAKQNGSALAVGLPAFTEDGKGQLNAMINLANFNPTQPEKMQVYAKNHLVPFGEFKPIPRLTEPLYRYMNMPLSDFQRGGIGQEPFDMAGEKVAFNICYEDGFGDELIASAKKSTLLANASNMAWYGQSNAMWQQLQQSQARALELGRYMIRATNNGATSIIDPKGKVVATAPINVATVLEGTAYGMVGQTPYMRLGSSWYLFYTMMGVVGVLMFYRPRREQAVEAVAPTVSTNNGNGQPETTPAAATESVKPVKPKKEKSAKPKQPETVKPVEPQTVENQLIQSMIEPNQSMENQLIQAKANAPQTADNQLAKPVSVGATASVRVDEDDELPVNKLPPKPLKSTYKSTDNVSRVESTSPNLFRDKAKSSVIINPDQALRAQAQQAKPQINLQSSEFLSDYPPIVVAAREAERTASARQTYDGVSPSDYNDRLFGSVRQSEQDKRQGFKPKRKKNKRRK